MVALNARRVWCAALFLVALSLGVTTTTDGAQARKRGGYAPPQASIVVDANTGRMLQGANPDAPRFPASITKVMTLYMLFEQLEQGKLQLNSELSVSSFAARQAPSKIGFDRGETIEVQDAIRALVTKSANDVAVVVAEAIGGDQETFAEMMTKKARSIGMSRTTFRNASGLPNPAQVTTARDLSVLGRAIHERFPKYWHFFQTRNFEYAGRNYRNHNKLLGRVEGVDGIKTGYTRASGFNLLTSAREGNRHVIAVVLGGRSGRTRDAQMASLVENHISNASAGAKTHSVLAEARQNGAQEAPVRVATAIVPSNQSRPEVSQRPEPRVAETPVAAPVSVARPVIAQPVQSQADSDRTRMENVRRVIAASPQAAPTRTVTSQIIAAAPARTNAAPVAAFAPQPPAPTAQISGPQLRWNTGAKPANPAPLRQSSTTIAQADPETTASVKSAATARKGLVIQLGASDSEQKARGILDNAKAKNRTVLAEAEAFTEAVDKNGTKLFRARFGGFDDANEANAACSALKRSGFACFVQRI
jgi:D-alanyl-D-alanine carboxypeptidase